jgi:hypothetical protein
MNRQQRREFEYGNKILEIIETQLRNDDNSLNQSDLQGHVDALVARMMRISINKMIYSDQYGMLAAAMDEVHGNLPESFELFIDRMVDLGVIETGGRPESDPK